MKMKSIIPIFVATLFIIAGCGGCKQSGAQSDDFITVDVTASYPKKELILQDFMDVEYIPLETTDDFITQGFVKAIGKELVLAGNYTDDGDIYIFDRTGKALRKINRKGQGGEEYSQTTEIILDEDNHEMFVKDYPARKILVYDLHGNFKRSFKFTDAGYYLFTFNYDRDHLICYNSHLPVDDERSCHLIISKQDGSIIRKIPLPFKEIKTPIVIMEKEDVHITPSFYLTIPRHGKWLLMSTSSDTVYSYLPEGNIIPFIARTPSIHSMEPEVFLFPGAITDRYYFMQTMKKEFDFARMKGFPTTDLVYDRQEKAIYIYTVYNDDYSNKKQIYMNTEPVDGEIVTWQPLEAHQLVEAREKGQLKGRLKEIAATLDEEDNPVIMLIKHKK
jgi:hypothetical protein